MAKSSNTCESLFPILGNRPLGGLARLASEATHADDGHLIEFKAMQARSILNRSVSKRMGWMAWTINPFRGCEFGCKYCYARYTHEFLQPEPVTPVPAGTFDAPQQSWALAFEHEIYLKENSAWLLEQELRSFGAKIRESGEEIAIGTATDPYQPIERRVGITRSLLEVFARQEGLRIGIITKSNLITRDIDLLAKIARNNRLVVHITVTTIDSELARKLEPRAPRPDLRLEAVHKLSQAGIMTGVLCCPLLPGINDSSRALEEVAGRAAAAGASFMGANPLFLKSCSRPTYLSFVREHFPALIGDYEKQFATRDFADTAYRRKMSLLLKKACVKFGLAERASESLTREIKVPGKKSPQRDTDAVAAPQRMLFA
ncbi:MAG: radical SAM protein [Acidobacteriota bacterium]